MKFSPEIAFCYSNSTKIENSTEIIFKGMHLNKTRKERTQISFLVVRDHEKETYVFTSSVYSATMRHMRQLYIEKINLISYSPGKDLFLLAT